MAMLIEKQTPYDRFANIYINTCKLVILYNSNSINKRHMYRHYSYYIDES